MIHINKYKKPYKHDWIITCRSMNIAIQNNIWYLCCLKGEQKRTRPPETLRCSKSKTWGPRMLKLHQPVYLIRYTGWWSFRVIGLQVLGLEHFKVSGGLVFFAHPLVDFLITFSWLCHDSLKTVSWVSHDCLMTVSWPSHDRLMTISWPSHDCLMTFL